jgi:hypothetical protein
MYENYFDAARGVNIADFKLMKTVDKCLERKLSKNRPNRMQPIGKFAAMAGNVGKSRMPQKVSGAASETNQILMNALYSQQTTPHALEESSTARNQAAANKGEMSFEYSDAEASQHNIMTALLPPWSSNNESHAGMYCYYKRGAGKSPEASSASYGGVVAAT